MIRPKMRVSFDLDEVLFVSPLTHSTEPALPFPFPLKKNFRNGCVWAPPR